jgi:oxygen-dependent protoporphyrinogen oxidase
MGLDVVLPRRLPDHDIAVGEYLRGRLGDALVDRLAGPLVGGIYGTPIDELSLDAVVPTLRDAERDHRSLLFAGLAQGRAARAAAAARTRSATAATVATGATAGRPSLGMFISLVGGMGRLVDGLAARLADDPQVEVETGVTIARLERRPGGLSAVRADGGTIDAASVVVTTPSPVTARLVADLSPNLASSLLGIRHGSTAVVSIAYPAEAFERPPAGHGFLVAEGEDLTISACTIASGKWPQRAPAGHVLLRAFAPDGPSLALEDEALIALARHDLDGVLGVHGDPELVRVARWTAAMPRYTVGHLDRVAEIEARTEAVPGLVLAGAPYRGVGIPDCVSQGRTAADRVAATLTRETAAA